MPQIDEIVLIVIKFCSSIRKSKCQGLNSLDQSTKVSIVQTVAQVSNILKISVAVGHHFTNVSQSGIYSSPTFNIFLTDFRLLPLLSLCFTMSIVNLCHSY